MWKINQNALIFMKVFFLAFRTVFVCVFINITLFHRDKWSGETLFLLAHTSLCLTEAF